VVAVVHDDVTQIAADKATLDVASQKLNIKPDTVTELLPETALFICASDSTAASKLNPDVTVPTTTPTVRVDTITCDNGWLDKHPNVVIDVHAEVLHAASEICAVSVQSSKPKSRPDTVTELPPL
jgi:hypothetical protein